MKEPIPIQQWLPAGPLRDMGEKYVSQLPDVAQNPIGPESLMHQSDHSWSEYLVAYSANREEDGLSMFVLAEPGENQRQSRHLDFITVLYGF